MIDHCPSGWEGTSIPMNHEPGDLPFSDQPFSFEEKEWRAQELVHTALGMPPTLVPRIGVKVFL